MKTGRKLTAVEWTVALSVAASLMPAWASAHHYDGPPVDVNFVNQRPSKYAECDQYLSDTTARRTTLAAIQLLDRNGRVVSGPEAGASYAAIPEVAAALRGQTETVLRRNGSYQQVYRFEWLTRAAAIRIHQPTPPHRPGTSGGSVEMGLRALPPSPR